MTVTAPDGIDDELSDFSPTFGLDLRQLDMMMKIYNILGQKYDVVCTNPPYMGSSGMNMTLSDYVKKNYPNTKSDLSTCFMEKCEKLCKDNGYYTMLNIPVWMFLSSYEKLRETILMNNSYSSMVHFGRGVFGSDFGTTAFVISKKHISDYVGVYRRLFEKQGAVDSVEQKEKWFFEGMGYHTAKQENFSKIPGMPVAYWVSENFVRAFENKKIGDIALARNGMKTGDNTEFVRLWWESVNDTICFYANNANDAVNSRCKWFPYNKGGEYHKWYGNNEYIVNWENCGERVIGNAKQEKRNVQDYPVELKFKPLVTWSLITSSIPSFRYKTSCICDIAGMSFWDTSNNDMLDYLLGLCNTKIALFVLNMIAPTINFQAGDISRIPVIVDEDNKNVVDTLVNDNIENCKSDWDSFETSWDFERHPLV